ncbi:MAG: tetratricopeptide repeat protein [Bacteroidetes bacterium]|nr:tetratricopeptide repeat protein [Bacteroidota bacterium]
MLKEERDSAFSILKVNQVFIKNKFGERNELMAMCNDLLGDSYMSHSDAFTAVSYYRKSLVIRKTIYKETHPRIAFSYSNIARYYSFKMEKDSALYFAKIAYNSFEK